MTDQPDTPEPTEQDAADAFYESIYGESRPAELTTDEEQNFYTEIFPNN